MSVIVDVSAAGVRIPVARERVRRVALHVLRAERVRDALVSIAFVSDREIARLNARHVRHRGPTDVISFGLAPASDRGPVVGDVYIAPGVARRNAAALGGSMREELMRLVVHGVLHVLGHDHPDDAEARYASPMWKHQERLLRAAVHA